MRRYRRAALSLLTLGGLLAAGDALAVDGQIAAFELVNLQFDTALSNWQTRVFPYAERLFLFLVTIEMMWTLYEIIFKLDLGFEGSLESFFWKAIRLTFLYNLLLASVSLATKVIDTYAFIGKAASGADGLAATDLLIKGWQIALAYALAINKTISLPGLNHFLLGESLRFTLYILIASLAWIAISIAITVIESKVTIAIGFFQMAFAGSRFTVGLAQTYPMAVVKAGIRIMVSYAILGVILGIIDTWWILILNPLHWGFQLYISMTFSSVLMAWLTFRIPRYIADAMPSDAVNLRMFVE